MVHEEVGMCRVIMLRVQNKVNNNLGRRGPLFWKSAFICC